MSASHTRDEALAVIVHGAAASVDFGDPANAGFRRYCVEVYGPDWEEWGAFAAYARIDPNRMYTYRSHR